MSLSASFWVSLFSLKLLLFVLSVHVMYVCVPKNDLIYWGFITGSGFWHVYSFGFNIHFVSQA